MAPDDPGLIARWLDDLRAGEGEAARRLWDCYFDRMVSLARAELRSRRREAVEDEEDAALIAFDSFCRGLARGRFEKLHDSDDLWRLLALLTVRKARDQLERQSARKRGGGRVSVVEPPDLRDELDHLAGREPTPELAAMVADEYVHLGNDLGDESLRRVLDLRMDGYTREEIAERLGCAVRTVGRKLEMIRTAMAAAMAEAELSGTRP